MSLSEQNLVDCALPSNRKGCDGGWMVTAFDYIINSTGVDTEASYPYESQVRTVFHIGFTRTLRLTFIKTYFTSNILYNMTSASVSSSWILRVETSGRHYISE